MNGHTNILQDFIDNVLIQLPDSYDADIIRRRRNNDKSKTNEHGLSLIELCISSGLRILNGRKLGDFTGKCTYYGPMCKNPTLIDYGLIHKHDYKDIVAFNVQDLSHLSDHCLIYTCVTAKVNEQRDCIRPILKENLQVIPGRFLWEEKHRAPFIESLNSPDSRQKINDFI
jgi:hypothetical protein